MSYQIHHVSVLVVIGTVLISMPTRLFPFFTCWVAASMQSTEEGGINNQLAAIINSHPLTLQSSRLLQSTLCLRHAVNSV